MLGGIAVENGCSWSMAGWCDISGGQYIAALVVYGEDLMHGEGSCVEI